jgi:uncharacterized protein (DUF2267 family)
MKRKKEAQERARRLQARTGTMGLEEWDRTIHKANSWLKDLMTELGWDDRHKAFVGLRAVLHALRDRLTVNEAVHLGAELPVILRGVYYDGWDPAKTPIKDRRKEEFLLRVAGNLPGFSDIDPQEITIAVFMLLSDRVSEGEIRDIKQVLPQDLQPLWPLE